jgi:glyoxylase-like metal-dependent hydrolase (beta-lactamase superfamily II)
MMTARAWVIRNKGRVVVVDSGVGNHYDEKFNDRFGISYRETTQESFQKGLSISTDEVTDVVMTHLHFDHAGGLLTKLPGASELQITFPKAKLHLASGHYDYSKKATPRDLGSFHEPQIKQIIDYYRSKNLLQLYQSQEGFLKVDEINMQFICAHGHTPWQLLPFTKDYFFMGDTVPTHAHIDIPWVMGYDMAPGVSAQERAKIYDLIISKNLTVIFNHDINFWGAKLAKSDKGYVWTEKFASTARENIWETL